MTRKNKWTAYLVVICMVFSVFGNGITLFGAELKSIELRTVEDLMSLAEKCKLDTWSQGKYIKLMNDIDLSGSGFNGIPIFGGEFDGGGYTLSGLSIEGKGQAQGFFRYIEEGGMVKNLTLKGNASTSGTKKIVGGIAGQNAGTIKDCNFIGNVNGESYIGGIAGINEANGKIIGVVAQGIVTGTHYVGGIVGENLGTILISTNKAKVNNAVSEVDVTLESIENLDKEHLNASENIKSNTDVGGIAGFSTGIIQGCENQGVIGYQHIGYNVGGIVGRQSGYVNACVNYGEVYGRKDVGGIAGQIEPYITLQFSEGKLGSLQDELNKLQSLMNKAIADTSSYSNDISTQLNNTKSYVDSAIDSTSSLVRQTETLYNGTMDSVNDLSARVSSTLDDLVPILDKARTMGDDISVAVDELREATSAIEVTSDKGQQVLDKLQDVLDNFQDNGKDYTKAMEAISDAMSDLNSSIGDQDKMADALNALSKGFEALADSFSKMSNGVNDFKEAMNELKQWIKEEKEWNDLVTGLEEVSKALEEVSSATDEVIGAVGELLKAMDEGDITSAFNNLQAVSAKFVSAMNHLENALGAINKDDITGTDIEAVIQEIQEGTSALQEGMEDVEAAIEDLQKATSNAESEAARQKIKEGLKKLQDALGKLNEASKKITKALEGLKDNNDSGELEQIKKKLSDALKNMGAAIGDVSSSISEIQKALNEVNNQIQLKKLQSAMDLLEEAVDKLITAAKNTDKVIDSVKVAVDKFQDTAKSADDVTSKIKEALDSLHTVSIKGSDVAEEIHSLISDLAAKPTITFPNIDSNYIQTTDDLKGSLNNVSNSLGLLNDVMRENNDIIVSDLKSVSDQLYIVINLLIDATIDNEALDGDLSEYHEDISDQDTNNNTQGKLAKCTNEGEIQGDVNVGGVTGSMAIEYDFDPEDDVTKKGDTSAKFQYLTRAVVRECVNKGSVISKKNYVGGIVGRMDLGSVISCMGYGKIQSNDGDYIGGVAGASYSHILDSFAMCVLSGGKNVGGIVGYGTKLTHNYAMVEVEAYSESVGAIAGAVEQISEQSDNYFVDRGIAAIDNISYAGKATPISYEEFIKAPNLPKEFTSLSLTFMADGERVGEIPFKFGESISENELPQIPEKAGYYGSWPKFDYSALTFSATLEAIYTPYTTVVESTTSEDDRAVALIKGAFGADAVLSVTNADVVPPKDVSSNAKVWEVTIADTNLGVSSQDQAAKATSNPYELRLLVGEKGKNNIYVYQEDGTWKKINAKKNGSYAVVSMEGNSSIFCIEHQSFLKEIVTLIGGVLIMLLGITVGFKKRKTKQIGLNKGSES